MKIGVIGLGSIGTRHAINLKELGHDVVAWDPKITASGFVQSVALDVLLRDSDAVVIASPTKYHAMHMAACTKKMFVEKPIADERMLANQNVLLVGYNQRFHPCVLQARHCIRDYLGEPIWADFTCAQFNDKPAYRRDGVILNWSHEIDLALHLLGPAEVVASHTRLSDGGDDMTNIILRHDNGCITTIHLDYLTKEEVRGFHIQGNKGFVTASLPGRTIKTQANEHYFDGSYDDDYKEEMAAFIRRVDGKQANGCDVSEAIATLNICLEVRKQAGLQ